MSLVSYEPINLLSEINRLFGETGRGLKPSDGSCADTSSWMPAVDIKEESDKFLFLIDVPGVDKDHIDIAFDDGVLSIKGQRHSESKEEKENYSRIERISGSFYRRFTLPDTADVEKISAKTKNGVLELIVPKKEAAKPKKIEIKVEE